MALYFLSPIFSEIEATHFKILPVILYGGFIRLNYSFRLSYGTHDELI